MLRWRLISAAVILAVLAGLFWLDFCWNLGRPGLWLAPLLLLIAGLGVSELLDLFGAVNVRPSAAAAYAGTLLVVTAACAPLLWQQYPPDCPLGKLGWPLAALALGLALAFGEAMLRFREPGGSMVRVALTVFIITYLGLSLSFVAALRLHGDNATGMAALLSMALVVKLADTGAYAFGRALGRHKLTPRLSPGKTIEGAVGGVATACLVSWLSFSFLFPWLFGTGHGQTPWWASLIYGLILALAGMVGDLAESLLKRDLGRKDSSRWLRGLGGVLDIFDSVLLAAPCAYLCWVAGLVK